MLVSDVQKILDAECICCENLIDTEINSACGSDMMSDVLAYVKNQAVLLTGLVNPQVIRTAMMMDMRCIVFVRDKNPSEEMIELAKEADIVLLSSPKRMFDACGILYAAGLCPNEV